MRMEMPQEEGGYWRWRCPECWHSEVICEPERLDEMFIRNECAVVFSRMVATRLSDWSSPVQIRLIKTEDPMVFEMEARDAA